MSILKLAINSQNKLPVSSESPLDMEAILTECALALDIESAVVASCVKRWGLCAVVASFFGHRFALRSADVLALTTKDVSLAGTCIVQAVKIIMPWHFINQSYTNPHQEHRLFDTDYNRMHGATLDLGLASRSDRYVTRRVTHADRHALADQLAYMGIEV